MAPFGRKRLRGVVSSAQRVSLKSDSDRRLKNPQWQGRAWAYYGLVGEVHYAGQFYSRGLSQLRVFPEYRNDKGEWIEVTPDGQGDNEVPNAKDALAVWDRVQDPSGGRSALLSNYGRCRFISGESYLVVTTTDEGEQWEQLSTDELVKSGDQWRRRKAPGIDENLKEIPEDQLEPLPGQALVYRMWRPHPRYSLMADAPMLGVLDICEELVMLTRAVRARARSRIAGAGLFVYPIEADFESEDDQADGQPEGQDTESPFERSLRLSMITPIENEGDAASVVPVFAGVPADLVEKFKLISFAQASDAYPEIQLRNEAVTRLARGLDMPVEILLGLADANHWTSWQIDRQTWKAHLQPVAQEMVDDYTGVYYRPALKATGTAFDLNRFRLNYDPSKVVNNPDQTKDAKDLHDRFALSDDSLRQAGGFDEDDAPSEEEIAARIERAAYIRTGGQIKSGASQEEAPATEPDGSAASAGEPLVAELLEGAMALAIERCREIAGSRVRTRLQRRPNEDLTKLLDGVPNRSVTVTLGQDGAARIGVAARTLVAGGTDCLAGWMEDHGYPREWIEDTCSTVEEEAIRGLWRPRVKAVV